MKFYKYFVLTLLIFSTTFSAISTQAKEIKRDSHEHLNINPDNTHVQIMGENEGVVSDGVIRILAIGNSFSQDAVETYLYELAKNAGQSVVIGNLYIGGASLDLHWKNASVNKAAYSYRKIGLDGKKVTLDKTSIETAVADEEWDYISFQQASSFSGQYNTFVTPLPLLYNYVKQKTTNPEVKYILHQTWAYAKNSTHKGFANYNNNQGAMYSAIVDAVGRAKDLIKADLLVPAGTAIQNGRNSILGDNFTRDGYHLDVNIGRYTAACTWFEAIFGKSVIGNPFKPDALSDYEAKIAQYAAHSAVMKPNEVTRSEPNKADSISIAKVKWKKQKVEKGVIWKQAHFNDLYEAQQEINILEVDLRKKNINIDFAGLASGLKVTSDFVKEENAIGGINGSYFDMKNGGSTTFFKIDNKVINEGRTLSGSKPDVRLNGAITIDTDVKGKEIIDILEGTVSDHLWPTKIEASNVMVCGPLLIMNDTLVTMLKNPFNNNRHPRSAVAISGNKLILITVDGRNNQAYGMSLPELAFFLKQIGAEKALNLDGGGSTTLVLNTPKKQGILNYPSDNKKFDHEGERPAANVILIKQKR